jgi:hypothetical protein
MVVFTQWNVIIVYEFSQAERTAAARKYEERVRVAVNAIMRTQTGRALLQTFRAGLPQGTSIWIEPNHDSGGCNSRTGSRYMTDLRTGQQVYAGALIQFSPDRYIVDGCGWTPGMRPEEVLFHEMVHASRNLNNLTYNKTPLELMGDYEEFLAVLITNMYRTELGAKKLNRDYALGLLVDQPEAELFLSSKRQYIDAIRFLLDDQLVKAVASLSTPFNPFRDFKRLEAMHSDIRELLDDINPFVGMRESERLKAIGKKMSEQQQMSINSSSRVIQGL